MINIDSYKLVNVTENDCDLIFQWSNDKDVRLNSFNSNPIKYEDHIKWFKDKMKSNDSIMYIFKVCDGKVGLIRLDKLENNTYIINYSIAREHREKGYATILLRLVKEKYKDSFLIGKVKKENIASIKAFIKAEYIMKEKLDMYIFYSSNKEEL
ncbi:GNAT family N-acetyltransferase [Tissierella sp. MSJ-40]|uniref:GNAT family N-acetyltransferase n=1 Tax=Tissierella simiarum TaxID=2841534 RepID=A0ABS6E185_9FIRM|nr:GNAT family N-acetyltransferase [Tissierella simiarum]MBU5436664.1 GNAT family N-acetyltransferase [Tissierella simiarum]